MEFEPEHPGYESTGSVGSPAEDGPHSKALRPIPDGGRADAEARGIIVVSGLPRSGTSMMMKMLEAGGLAVLADRLRRPDADNPGGYYEFEPVKKIAANSDWLEQASGKAVKIISWLLFDLPADFFYKVVFMQRRMDEVLASQRRMLAGRGRQVDAGDDRMGRLFRRHLEEVEGWLRVQGNIEVLYFSYNEALKDPFEQARGVNRFLGGGLDIEKMAAVVDENLYRQRK